MKKISDLYNIDNDTLVKDIKINSKEVVEGDIFVCTMGVTADRHDFVNEAVKKGAKLIVASKKVDVDVPVVYVENTNKELISLAKKVYDYDESLKLIGVTGTNGKTTVALMIKHLLGNDTGYMGTNGIISNSFNEMIRNTTPDADRLYKYFKRFKEDNCKNIVMETSSESFYRNRLDGLDFEIGILTNITEDHLNIHKTIENYVDCKMDLFRKVKKDGFCILNTDDNYYDLALKNSNGKVLTYGKKESTLQIVDYKIYVDKTEITLKYNDKLYSFVSPFIGEVNVYNITSSILACLALGKDINELVEKVPDIPKVGGRLDCLDTKTDYKVILDYAHTLDAFKKIIPFLNSVKENRLIVITGAAGGRQQDKRPLIGEYLLENVDEVIFTMDDPRYEDPLKIIYEMIGDSQNDNYQIIVDREKAIIDIFDNAQKGDIILIAGKGIDNYMVIADKYIPYSDVEIIDNYFGNR